MDAGDIVHHRVVHQTTNRRSHRVTTRAPRRPTHIFLGVPFFLISQRRALTKGRKEARERERDNQRQQLFQRRKEKEKKNQGNVGR